MRKIACYIALLGVILLVSCEKETLDPRTNPRFSVTIIQEISASGVQLGADIYDFGDEEILEYGFVYTQSNSSPSLDQDDYVSKQGRPESSFELVANHSMTLGKKYYVSAFLRTPTTLVFSKSMEFVSQGSEGFIVNSVEWPERIYKEQRIVVKGSRFSRQKDNYKIKVGIFDAYPEVLDSNTVSIPLPLGLLTQTIGQDLETELQIEIGEKRYTEKRVLKYQEPVFETQPIQLIDFDEEVLIKGDFLDLGEIKIKIGNQEIPGLIATKNELRFFPYKGTGLNPTTAEPEITYSVRGINYPLGKIFRINGPKISGEKIILSRQSQVIPAVNFNLGQISDIKFYEEDGQEIYLEVSGGSTSGITVNTQSGIYPGRKFKMQFKSFGILSNFAEFEIANPVVVIKAKVQPYKYTTDDLALVSNGNAYLLTNQGIIEETLDGQFKQQKIADLPANFNQRYQYIKQVVEGGFVIGGGGTINAQPFYDLYYFSLEKLQWEKLPNLPAPYTSFNLVTSKNGFLVFQQAKELFNEVVGENWTLNLQSKIWERLPTDQERYLVTQTFYHNGETYLYGLKYSMPKRSIYRMRADFSWELYIDLPSSNNSNFANPLVRDGKFYVISNSPYYITEIDLVNRSLGGYTYPYSYFYGKVPVVYSEGIYLLSSENIQEDIRLNLF